MIPCDDCGRPAPEPAQASFQAVPVPVRCTACETKAQIRHYLVALPEDENDPEWRRLHEWEREFLPSVREQFEAHGTLSDKQVEKLEQVYRRLA